MLAIIKRWRCAVTHSGSELRNLHILALDGEIGHVSDIYFDDRSWTVRYLVVDTRNWLPGRKVLIHPHAVDRERREAGKLAIKLTKEQIRDSPGIEEDRPVSEQHQADLAAYYAWPLPYEGMAPMTGGLPAVPLPEPVAAESADESGDPHLRSMREILGYRVVAGEEEIGTIADLDVDDDVRVVRLVMRSPAGDTTPLAPDAVLEIDWAGQSVKIKPA